MSTFESMKANAKALRTEIQELLQIDRDELYGEKRLHEISFNHKGKEQFEMVFSLIEDLSKCHFDRVPELKTSIIQNKLQTYKEIFNRAKSLDLKNSNPQDTRDSIVQEVENHYEGFFEAVSSVINFANQAGTDFKQIEREARETLEKVKAHSEEQKNQMEEQKNLLNLF